MPKILTVDDEVVLDRSGPMSNGAWRERFYEPLGAVGDIVRLDRAEQRRARIRYTEGGLIRGVRGAASYLCVSPDLLLGLMYDPTNPLPFQQLSPWKVYFDPKAIEEYMGRRAQQGVKEKSPKTFRGRLHTRFGTQPT